jgi:hypothetical protein
MASETYTEAEATNEAVLLLTRKMRRLHAQEFAAVWAMLPDGAKEAIYAAERGGGPGTGRGRQDLGRG